MKIKHKFTVIGKLGIGLAAITLLLAGCGGGGGGGGSSGGAATGVATPSKVSVVNTN